MMTPNRSPRMHHAGFVVAAIEPVLAMFARAVSAPSVSPIFHDPLQRVRVAFVDAAGPGGASLELIEPADERSPVSAFLAKGGGLHHLCYEVDDLERQLAESRAMGHTVIHRPTPAIAFAGRPIAWVMTPQRLLIEFLASNDAPPRAG